MVFQFCMSACLRFANICYNHISAMFQVDKYHIIRSKRRTISLQITPQGQLLVRAPIRTPISVIQQFIDTNTTWITEHLEKTAKRKAAAHSYETGEKFLFLGKEVTLIIDTFKDIEIRGDSLHFPHVLTFRIQKELTEWYIRQARQVISGQVEIFAREMHTQYNGLTFSDTRSQWGRCTHDDRLQFSWRLVMAPLLTLNYVVIHELAHTIEKNHSSAFWSIVRAHTPSYRQQIKWLNTYGHSLVI